MSNSISNPIIGREHEIKILNNLFKSKEAEFIAVYGRRRVGKTYLIRNVFLDKNIYFFQTAGILKAPPKTQFKEFIKDIKKTFLSEKNNLKLENPKNWMSALEQLNTAIESVGNTKKIVLFLDEFPWMANRKKNLLQALDHYWNRHWSQKNNLKLIICGSAASWIIDNILNSKGGLHNRVTKRLPIEPFTLQETNEFLKHRGIKYNQAQILELYMCMGGIPHYLKEIQKGFSAIQNINQLCFQKNGALVSEFDNLYRALFEKSDMHESIVRALSQKRNGISRTELESLLSHKGGGLTKCLKELEHAGFITSFIPWGRKTKGSFYKLIDEYSLFYLHWIDRSSNHRIAKEITAKYWESIAQSPAWKSWSGYAFEAICHKHIGYIRKALHIPDGAEDSSWSYAPKNKPKSLESSGAQIDLLFDRPDGIINLCEIKYSNSEFKIDKETAQDLDHKITVFKQITQTKKQVCLSMITSWGLKPSMYSEDLVWSEMRSEDFFK